MFLNCRYNTVGQTSFYSYVNHTIVTHLVSQLTPSFICNIWVNAYKILYMNWPLIIWLLTIIKHTDLLKNTRAQSQITSYEACRQQGTFHRLCPQVKTEYAIKKHIIVMFYQ